jgi:RNA polymerase primary sigma factor
VIDQLVLLQELAEVRKKIHSLCAKTKCQKYPRCKKFCTICTSDEQSPFRKVIRNNGGNFKLYLEIRKELMERNYPLVISLANTMGGYSKDDLCQEGILGLCEAIDRFDFSYGNQFSTFAYHYIKKSILNFIRENQTVKLATRISYLTKVTEAAFDMLVQKKPYTTFYITPKELLREVNKLRKEKEMGKMEIRVSEVTGHLGRLKLQMNMMEIGPLEPNQFEHQEHSDSFYDLLNKELEADLAPIPIYLAEAIKLRFGLGSYTTPTPIQEIGAALGMTQQGIEYQIKQFFERQE